jgi:hypothetical protein
MSASLSASSILPSGLSAVSMAAKKSFAARLHAPMRQGKVAMIDSYRR